MNISQSFSFEPMSFSDTFAIFVKFFFLLTPPFVISVFLAVTKESTSLQKSELSVRITVALILLCTVLLFCGSYIFEVFGITLDSFRIGTGAILFLTAVKLVQGEGTQVSAVRDLRSLAVVPMAMPVTLGPASVGALIVWGGELQGGLQMALGLTAMIAAILCVGALLWASSYIERAIGKNGLVVMSKLTGLILAALSCQMIFTGASSFLKAAIST